MMAWMPAVILAAAQIALRFVGIAAMIWQEQVRSRSHFTQMRTASASGVVLVERRRDGAVLIIVPQGMVGRDGDAPARAAGPEARRRLLWHDC